MSTYSFRRQLVVVALAVGTTLFATTSCSAPSAESVGSVDPSAPLFNDIPQSIRDAGVLRIGIDASGLPYAIEGDDGDYIGITPEIAQALGEKIGLPVQFNNVKFADSVNGLKSGRLDVFWTFTKDRPEIRGQVDLVDFASTGAGLLVAAGNPKRIESENDLCGRTVVVQNGSNNIDLVHNLSQRCIATSNAPISTIEFPGAADAMFQVGQRAEAMVTSYPIAAYYGRTNHRYDLAGGIFDRMRAGITIKKGNQGIVSLMQKSIQLLIGDGTLTKILNKWNLVDLAIEQATVNNNADGR